DGRQIAEAEPYPWMMRIERSHHHLTDFAVGNDVAGSRSHDLDQNIFVDHHPRARRRLISDDTDVGGRIQLVRIDAAPAYLRLQGRPERRPGDRRFAPRGDV